MTFWYPGLAVVGVFGGAVLCLPVTRVMPWKGLFVTASYLAVDSLVLANTPRVHGLHWNWLGKAASLLLGLVAIQIFRLSRAEVGLKLPARGSWPWLWVGLGIALVWSLVAARGLDQLHTDVETLIFQATMPGFAEELVYRGVAYALLLKGFGKRCP